MTQENKTWNDLSKKDKLGIKIRLAIITIGIPIAAYFLWNGLT